MKKWLVCVCGHPKWFHCQNICKYECTCTKFVPQDPFPSSSKPPQPTATVSHKMFGHISAVDPELTQALAAVPDATGEPYGESPPRVWIESVFYDKDGHVEGVVLHDERFGEAVYCETVRRHYHGFRPRGI